MSSVSEAFREGRTQDIRAGLRTVEPRIITKVSDLLFFENKFNHLMGLYTTIKGLKQEEEDLQVNRKRLCTYLRKDLIKFHSEVNNEMEGYIAASVIKDLLEQLNGLNKRLLEIKLMCDIEPDIQPIPFTEVNPLHGSASGKIHIQDKEKSA